jgi:hypothetical protein
MPQLKKIALTLVLLALFGGALFFALRKQQGAAQEQEIASTEALKGLVAVDVEPFFKDERVQKILADKRLPVTVARVGSRDMAGKVVAGGMPDFMFASGVVAGNQIADAARKANVSVTPSSPFHSPLVIASWQPVAQILVANGIAKKTGDRTYGLDMGKLATLMLAKKKWNELQASQAYSVSRSVLVSTTDVRRSNSAAMYLALTSHALNGGEVVSDRATAVALATRLAELFKRQGYQENYVNGNFDDYLTLGPGKTPLAFIYEYQMVAHALAKKSLGADMVLIYPQPTIINKLVFVASSPRGRALADLLGSEPALQRIAVEYGLRVADSSVFMQAVAATGLAVEERVTQVIDPPSFELMAEMIDVVTQEMAK